MRRIASAISRPLDTRAMPRVGPVRPGKAHPAPTKSSLTARVPSVDLDQRALDGDHGPALELGSGVGVDADVGTLDRDGGSPLDVDLHALDLDVAAAAV